MCLKVKYHHLQCREVDQCEKKLNFDNGEVDTASSSVQLLLLLAERALPVDYQCRIESLKTQYFIDSRSVVK